MANTYVDYTATAAQTDFAFSFPYLEDSHVTVEIDGVATTDFTIVTTPATKVVLDSGATAGQIVRVRRKSQPDTNLVDFVNGSVLTESELDRAYLHNRYLAEEIAELNDASLQIGAGGTNWDAKSLQIKNLADPTDTTDATNKTYVDQKVNQASTGAAFPPTKWTFTGTAGANTTYSVTGAEINGDTAYDVSIDGAVKEPTADYTVDPDTDTLTIVPTLSGGEDIVVIQRGFGIATSTGTIGSSQIANGAVTTAKIENGAVTSAKISTTDTNFNVSDANNNIGTGALADSSYQLTVDSGTTKDPILAKANKASDYVDLNLENEHASGNGARVRLSQGNNTASIQYQQSNERLSLVLSDGSIPATTGLNISCISNSQGVVEPSGSMYSNPNSNVDLGTPTNQWGTIHASGFKVNGTNLQTVPTGTVSAFAGSAAPTGYLLCDGSSVNRTTYAALFGVISTTYGFVDSDTFNLPDLRGRVVAGLGESLLGAAADALGDDNGLIADTKEHLLRAAESGLRDHGHTTTNRDCVNGTGFTVNQGIGNPNNVLTTGTDASSAHNNVQPTIILNYIIKI